MTDTVKNPKKAAAPKAKAASAEKPAAPKAAVAPKPKAAPKAKAAAASGATLKVMQTGSPIGRQAIQRQTLIGLGLNKMNRTRELQDSPEVRGMIYKVRHLVKVVG